MGRYPGVSEEGFQVLQSWTVGLRSGWRQFRLVRLTVIIYYIVVVNLQTLEFAFIKVHALILDFDVFPPA